MRWGKFGDLIAVILQTLDELGGQGYEAPFTVSIVGREGNVVALRFDGGDARVVAKSTGAEGQPMPLSFPINLLFVDSTGRGEARSLEQEPTTTEANALFAVN